MALVVFAAMPATLDSLKVGSFFRQADTRTLARAFIESHAHAGSTVLVQPVLRAAHAVTRWPGRGAAEPPRR